MSKRYLWLFFAVTTLITSGIFLTTPPAQASDPTIFIDPSEVVGDLTPAPGSLTSLKVNVSNIGVPGLIGHELYLTLPPETFKEQEPLTNQNFTTDASGWTPTLTTGYRGTPTYGYYLTDGNPSPGSGPGCYRMRINATGTQTGTITYYLNQSFVWNVGAPPDQGALLSFAYSISGNSFGSVGVGIRAVKPDKTFTTLITSKTFNTVKPWSYNFTATASTVFTLPGTYVFQLRTLLTTAGNAATNYLEMKWDDVGLILAPVSATEGSFFTSDPRNVGKTYFTSKYLKFPTNVSLYVADSLTGIPWTDVYPVQGSGTIVNLKLLVNYGWADLDLWGTKLTQPGLIPPYTPEEISHTALDAYFDNRIPGDITGPENPPGSGKYPYDAKVDGYDLFYLGKKFGTSDHVADFTGPENPVGSGMYPPDGIVDGRDLISLGKNFGKHYP